MFTGPRPIFSSPSWLLSLLIDSPGLPTFHLDRVGGQDHTNSFRKHTHPETLSDQAAHVFVCLFRCDRAASFSLSQIVQFWEVAVGYNPSWTWLKKY